MTNLHLTVEQEKILQENEKLIHVAIRAIFTNGGIADSCMEYEDLVQIGYIALCKAIKTYNSTKQAFSTYAVTIIKNDLCNVIRQQKARSNRDAAYKADNIIDDEEFNEEVYLKTVDENELIMNKIIAEQQTQMLLELSEKYKGVAGKGVKAILLMAQSYTCSEIAKMFNTDAKTITAWISRARKKLKKEPALLALLSNH